MVVGVLHMPISHMVKRDRVSKVHSMLLHYGLVVVVVEEEVA
jgi:hypothetical protein